MILLFCKCCFVGGEACALFIYLFISLLIPLTSATLAVSRLDFIFDCFYCCQLSLQFAYEINYFVFCLV